VGSAFFDKIAAGHRQCSKEKGGKRKDDKSAAGGLGMSFRKFLPVTSPCEAASGLVSTGRNFQEKALARVSAFPLSFTFLVANRPETASILRSSKTAASR
jgi:hypothetical protein